MNGRLAGGLAGALATLAGVAGSRRRARGIPFSPVDGGRRIGPEFPERAGLVDADAPVPRGEMDDLEEFARPDFDTDRVSSDVRGFYEETTAYTMTYRTRWHRPFRAGASLAAPITTRIEQLNLPAPGDERPRRLASRFAPIDPDVDPRPGARAWVRTDSGTGEAVFVALYAHHDADASTRVEATDSPRGERYVNIAAPLPGGNLSTVLHLDAFDTDADGAGLRLTTRAPGDPGLYLVRAGTGFWLPMQQTFEVWPADATDAPDAAGSEPRLAATHEMWLLGRPFLTVTYGITERPGPPSH